MREALDVAHDLCTAAAWAFAARWPELGDRLLDNAGAILQLPYVPGVSSTDHVDPRQQPPDD